MGYTLNNIKRSPFPGLDYSYVSSDFGPRSFWNPVTQKQENNTHHGIDLTSGTTIVAIAPGVVTATRNNIEGYTEVYSSGNYVTIKHDNGIYSTYCHMVMGSVKVSVGQRVDAGTELGTKGSTGWSTGPHVHLGIRDASGWLDPKPFLLGEKSLGDDGQAPTPAPAPQPTASNDDLLTLVKKTIRGDFGNGQARANALGNNYSEVQRQVNLNYRNGTTSWSNVRLY